MKSFRETIRWNLDETPPKIMAALLIQSDDGTIGEGVWDGHDYFFRVGAGRYDRILKINAWADFPQGPP